MPDLISILWITSPFTVTVILFWMVRKRLYAQYPIFFSYLVLQILGFLVLYPVRKLGTATDYFYAYWVLSGLTGICSVAIICELLSVVLKPFIGLRDAGKLLFRWAAAVMVIMALVVASSSHVEGRGYIVSAVLELERCMRVVQCGLLLFVLCCSKYLGISASNRAYGILLGFGLNASTCLFLLSMSTYMGPRFDHSLSLGMSAAYNLATIVWLGYVLKPEPARKLLHLPISSPLVRWNEIATAMGHGARVAYMPAPDTYDIQKIVHRN
ncbi:MAG TPA: hypothetical protein VE986_09850, partial [Hyphomicrobiales bacterium]|nr:hypothetical protein [Hyphomicrobiales bacterium]